MTMINRTPVTVEEMLAHFVSRSNAPSTMGSQLARLAAGSDARHHGAGWGPKAKAETPTPKDPEGPILRDSNVYRLEQGLAAIKGADLDIPALVSVTSSTKDGMGRVVVRVLRAFQEALAAPTEDELGRAHQRAQKVTQRPDEPPSVFVERQLAVFQKAIGEYRAPRGIEAIERLYPGIENAAELYADCLLVLSMFVQSFNRKKAA